MLYEVITELTILLDIDPEVGLRRALSRNLAGGIHKSEGRFEAEHLDFHHRIREGYLAWAALHSGRFRVVDASGSPDEIFSQVLTYVEPLLDG